MNETRHESIADELTDEILRGRYRPGDRLPSERELAARYGVNRGTVREAIKKLEQLGLAHVLPGGARVLPLEEASLDVIGPLLALNELPDAQLVEQMLTVMSALMKVAAQQAMHRASDEQIDTARALIARLRDKRLGPDERIQIRHELGRQFMTMSGNLVLMLIARALRMQIFAGDARTASLIHGADDQDVYLQRMDEALSSRDADAAVATLQAVIDLNQRQVLNALRAAHANGNGVDDGHRKLAS